MADALNVTKDYLLGGAANAAAGATFTDRKLLRQFQEVERLPDDDKLIVKALLNAFLTKRQSKTLIR